MLARTTTTGYAQACRWTRRSTSSRRHHGRRGGGVEAEVQSVGDRGCGRDGRVHGGARYQHRQRRVAAPGRRPGCQQRRKHMGVDVLSGVERHRAADDRMAGDDIWSQAAVPAVHLPVHPHLPAVWHRAESVDAGPLPRDSRRRRRRASADGAGHPGGHLPP